MAAKKKKASKKKTSKKKTTRKKVSEADGRKTNNLSRVNRIKKTQRDEIRKKFKAIEYIQQLEDSSNQLLDIISKLSIAKQIKAKLKKSEKQKLLTIRAQVDLLIVQRDTIKVHIDLNLRRLKYCIPELKSVELSDPDGKNPFGNAPVLNINTPTGLVRVQGQEQLEDFLQDD